MNNHNVEETFLRGRHHFKLFLGVISMSLTATLSCVLGLTPSGHLRLREVQELTQSGSAGKWWARDLNLCLKFLVLVMYEEQQESAILVGAPHLPWRASPLDDPVALL